MGLDNVKELWRRYSRLYIYVIQGGPPFVITLSYLLLPPALTTWRSQRTHESLTFIAVVLASCTLVATSSIIMICLHKWRPVSDRLIEIHMVAGITGSLNMAIHIAWGLQTDTSLVIIAVVLSLVYSIILIMILAYRALLLGPAYNPDRPAGRENIPDLKRSWEMLTVKDELPVHPWMGICPNHMRLVVDTADEVTTRH
ncbi:hypothetical protein FE257_002310 [Aspergillus nanangensis]|uniref:Uncharacterized protein n=1 Tax=Aspergillus nanangensis TaxID=2582783 RepID=A0AAD4GP47_ASPNN|nr:hypothetical protein FE257_002310 [Aspergillus nanangensis]